MDWNAIGAVGEIVGGLAVIATLVYLARQIGQIARQQHHDAFKQYHDQLNAYLMHVSGSEELTGIVERGRRDLASLTAAERIRFDFVHFQLLNFVESHYTLATATAIDEAYRAWALRNLADIVRSQLAFPGCIQLWREAGEFFDEDVRSLVDRALAGAPSTSASGAEDAADASITKG